MNVLIVDDDRSVQRALADMLTKQGYVVTVERDGEWAVQTFEKKSFDLVILDLLLPGLSGYEVAKQIRATAKGKRVPIIMISGVYRNPVHQREAVEKHGAFALLEKPIDLKLLRGTIIDALGDRVPAPSAPRPPAPPPPPIEEDEKTGEFMADDAQREEVEMVDRTMQAQPPPPPPPTPEPARTPPIPAPAPSPDLSPSIRATRPDRARTREIKRPAPKPPPPPPPIDTQEASTREEAPWEAIEDKPFAKILAEAYRTRFDGAVRLRRGSVKKIVYFRTGTPELVKSNLLVECLGRVLVKEKLISEAECEESLRRMKQSKRMQGTVLIEMGCISPHNLQHALVLQLQHKIYDAFSWDEGEYQFTADAPLPAEPLSIGMTAAQLIVEGVKRTYDEKRLFKTFGGFDGQYVTPSQDPLYALQDAQLGPEEQELLQLADGHKTLATLRALEVLPAFETDRFFFAMSCAQMVDFRATPAEGKSRVSFAEIAAAQKQQERTIIAPPPLPPPVTVPAGPPPLPPKKAAPPPAENPWNEPKPSAPPPPVPSPAMPPKREPVLAKSMGSLLPELSEVVSLPRVTGAESQQREKLAGRLSGMRALDYFEILGVKRDATREDVKRAYFALAKEYHPDKHFGSNGAETRAVAQQIYDLISTAHDTLTDKAERERYVAELQAGTRPSEDANVGKILAAEGKFQRGEDLMRSRHFIDAHRLFGEAIALYPDEGEFHAWEGWALFQADPRRADDAMRSIEQSIALNPRLDKGYLFLGYIFKASGRPDKAERQFEKAIQANPDCTEALRELRLLGRPKR